VLSPPIGSSRSWWQQAAYAANEIALWRVDIKWVEKVSRRGMSIGTETVIILTGSAASLTVNQPHNINHCAHERSKCNTSTEIVKWTADVYTECICSLLILVTCELEGGMRIAVLVCCDFIIYTCLSLIHLTWIDGGMSEGGCQSQTVTLACVTILL